MKGHSDSVDQLCWHPSHQDLLATASGDKTIRIWDARGNYNLIIAQLDSLAESELSTDHFNYLKGLHCISEQTTRNITTALLSSLVC